MGSGAGRVVPPLTVRMARASDPPGTAAMWARDRLDELFVDEDFADWYPADGRKRRSPARLALVSVLQYAENLTGRQAAEAVRCRLDSKYRLGLGAGRSGVRLLSTQRVQGPDGPGRPGRPAAGRYGRPSCGGWAGQTPRPGADGPHPCARRGPPPEPGRTGRRDLTDRAGGTLGAR
ncbi:transposase [Streptomyces rugosispiralis]|uniref:transposase n=1 Tax=Streptomyces rugosispiralis TaxID=2967341 RepID=UPI003703D9B5